MSAEMNLSYSFVVENGHKVLTNNNNSFDNNSFIKKLQIIDDKCFDIIYNLLLEIIIDSYIDTSYLNQEDVTIINENTLTAGLYAYSQIHEINIDNINISYLSDDENILDYINSNIGRQYLNLLNVWNSDYLPLKYINIKDIIVKNELLSYSQMLQYQQPIEETYNDSNSETNDDSDSDTDNTLNNVSTGNNNVSTGNNNVSTGNNNVSTEHNSKCNSKSDKSNNNKHQLLINEILYYNKDKEKRYLFIKCCFDYLNDVCTGCKYPHVNIKELNDICLINSWIYKFYLFKSDHLCHHFIKGNCKYGNKCNKVHISIEEIEIEYFEWLRDFELPTMSKLFKLKQKISASEIKADIEKKENKKKELAIKNKTKIMNQQLLNLYKLAQTEYNKIYKPKVGLKYPDKDENPEDQEDITNIIKCKYENISKLKKNKELNKLEIAVNEFTKFISTHLYFKKSRSERINIEIREKRIEKEKKEGYLKMKIRDSINESNSDSFNNHIELLYNSESDSDIEHLDIYGNTIDN